HFHRQLAIAALAALGLARHHNPAGLMQNPHGSFNLVDVLPAFAATAKRVDLQIGWINFYRSAVGNFSNNVNASKSSVPPFVRIEGRAPPEPVHAALGL